MPDPIRKISLSRWATRLLEAHPEWRAELDAGAPFARAEMDNALHGPFADEAALERALRELRSRVLLRTMARDLSGRADRGADGVARLAEVCGAMSELAEAALAAALGFL